MKMRTQLMGISGALLVIGLLNTMPVFYKAHQLSNEERLINFTGLVRGGSQRLVKIELSGENTDDQIRYIEKVIRGLKMGDEELNLNKIVEEELQGTISDLEIGWLNLKEAIFAARKDRSLRPDMVKSSEAFWELTDAGVTATSSLISKDLAWLGNVGLVLLFLNIGAAVGVALIAKKIGDTLRKASNSIVESATDIAATVEEQELSTSIQASSVNETVTTMDELQASFQQAILQAEASSKSAQDSIDLAEAGNLAVVETLVEMTSLKERVAAIANQILQLSEQTGQIGEITKLVADLASRTNMLALNAAVEAANAGDYGKGFAVVASEIRKLADESKKATAQIYGLVGDIQSATDSTVMVTEEGTKAVDQSTRVAQRASHAFESLAAAINEAHQSTQQTMLNVKQQSAAVDQVLQAMASLDGGASESALGIQQTIKGVTQLKGLAANLQSQV
jgi:methyl-accepting chemotaxis protein